MNDEIVKHMLTGKDMTHLRKDGSQAEVHAHTRGFLSSLHQNISTLIVFFLIRSLISARLYFFVCSDFDFSISCADDLSWRREVSEGIVAGRGVSWLFWRLNT